MQLEFHGGLRDFFPSTRDFDAPGSISVGELLQLLHKENPLAVNILLNTRLADNERILENATLLDANGTYHLLPPPGGG